MKCFLVVIIKYRFSASNCYCYEQHVSPTVSALIEENHKVPSLPSDSSWRCRINFQASHSPRLSILLMLNFPMDIVLRAIDFPVSLSHSSQPTYSEKLKFKVALSLSLSSHTRTDLRILIALKTLKFKFLFFRPVVNEAVGREKNWNRESWSNFNILLIF